MLVTVKSTFKKEEIIELLEQYHEDGINYKTLDKNRLEINFETEGFSDPETAIKITKGLIKAQKWSSVLYFSVEAK
ncbi:MAG: hypothetical protein ACK5G7_01575 [Erysipelotrichaceae bacterium]